MGETDLISRQAAIDALERTKEKDPKGDIACFYNTIIDNKIAVIESLPSVQPTLCGYDIEHLELIARVLRKEDLQPDRVAEALTDIGRIVAIVKDELEEALKKEMWEYGRDRLD